MLTFKNTSNGFNYVFEQDIEPYGVEFLKMPVVTPNKRGINDIGFAVEDGIVLYATISEEPLGDIAIWQEIQVFDEINKTTSFIKIVNTTDAKRRVNIRAILN